MLTAVSNTTALAAGQITTTLTMSSREIADLVESRHDKVKQSIERLASRGVIAQPPVADEQAVATTPTGGSRKYTTQVYQLQKRDSFVVVAQLSPEFTARLVDRWQQLEQEKESGGFTIPRTLGEALQLAANQAREMESMRDDVAALGRLSAAEGSLCITDAAKALQIRPKDLFAYLQGNGWIYKRPGSASWLGYQSKTTSTMLEHKVTTVLRADGTEKVTEQVRITPKGLTSLAKLIPAAATAVRAQA